MQLYSCARYYTITTAGPRRTLPLQRVLPIPMQSGIKFGMSPNVKVWGIISFYHEFSASLPVAQHQCTNKPFERTKCSTCYEPRVLTAAARRLQLTQGQQPGTGVWGSPATHGGHPLQCATNTEGAVEGRNSTGQTQEWGGLKASGVCHLLFSFPELIGFLCRFLWILISYCIFCLRHYRNEQSGK